jgi:hypothetical protein
LQTPVPRVAEPRRQSLAFAFAIAIAIVACKDGAVEAATPGPACTALLEAARRAETCDPTLGDLAARIEAAPEESQCSIAARALLDDEPGVEELPRLRSVHDPRPMPDDSALTLDERRALAELPLPAELRVVPDLRPGPGVPPTTADIDRLPLSREADGVLRGFAAPGARTLRLRHAGIESVYCLELHACETTSVTAHGARLARSAASRPGPC